MLVGAFSFGALGFCSALAIVPVAAAQTGPDAQVLPRVPLASPPLPESLAAQSAGEGEWLLEVKFQDGLGVRANESGALVTAEGDALPEELAEFVADRTGVRFTPSIRIDGRRLDALLERARIRSGRAQPDLRALFEVRIDGDDEALLEVATALRDVDGVEFVQLIQSVPPPPGDIAPPTADFTALQGYIESDPGIDYRIFHNAGVDGASVRYTDCEYAWFLEHEDLVDLGVQLEPGQTIGSQVLAYADHGTAVLGVVAAPHNGYGVNGAAPAGSIHAYPEYTLAGWRRVECVTSAIADSGPGDIVHLEMQVSGGGAFVVAEWQLGVWLATRVGTDAGVVVVAAAGNGGADLDGPSYASYRQRGDSGAIIVGAGTPDTLHNRVPFSTFGARVDLQAWGLSVMTTGYGNHFSVPWDELQDYTAGFSGTSSASALIAGAAVLVQDYATRSGYPRLDSRQMRALLGVGGIPSAAGDRIGLFPNLAAVLAELDGGAFSYCPSTPNGGFAGGARFVTSAVPSVTGPPLDLRVEDAAPNSFALFLVGGGTAYAPVGGGFLCVGEGPVPFRRIDPPVVVDAFGAASLSVDPATFGGGIVAGDSLHFQLWFRDIAGPHGGGSNTSDAKLIRFVP